MKKLIATIIIIIFLGLYGSYKSAFFQTNKKSFRPIPYTYTREHFQSDKQNSRNETDYISSYNHYCLLHNKKNCLIFPQQSIIADQIWLKSVQHAGQIQGQPEVLAAQITTINNLNPFREYPYIFSQRILPISKENNNYTEREKKISRENTINIGEKGLVYFCLPNAKDKINDISASELQKAYSLNDIKNSLCSNYLLPQALAFNYFYYLDDAQTASDDYKITALSYGAPAISLNMPAIVLGRGGFHSKSALLRYEKYLDQKEPYLLEKAIFEYTLDLITQSATTENCSEDLTCLQKGQYISQQISKNLKQCTQKNNTRQLCEILDIGIAKGFIQKDGTLIYPVDPENFTYARRTDRNDRRIIPQEDVTN